MHLRLPALPKILLQWQLVSKIILPIWAFKELLKAKNHFMHRTRLIVAAKAAGIQPIDSVFSDVADMDALHETVLISKSLGFEGMGCIHPRQIPVIKQGFAPDKAEIEKSKKIVLAFEAARRNGLGVVALGSKMIDPPVVARAQKTIDLAIGLGLIPENWIDEAQDPVNQDLN